MKTTQIRNSLLLLLAAVIWGSAFVAQSEAMELIHPFTLQAVRSLIGSLFLVPVILILDAGKKKNGTYRKMTKTDKKNLLVGGLVCGIVLCIASNLQQYGMYENVNPGKAGFITAMYILLVPVFGLIMGRKIPFRMWICIAAGVVGLYLLCIESGSSFTINFGDILVILCAAVFAVHIMVVDHFVKTCDGVKLSCMQFFIGGLISSVLMFAFSKPSIDAIIAAAFPILYAGIGSCGIAYTLQIIGQKYTPPTLASLIMSLESVFAVLTEVVILGVLPSMRESVGCIVMFAAIIVSQLPEKLKKS